MYAGALKRWGLWIAFFAVVAVACTGFGVRKTDTVEFGAIRAETRQLVRAEVSAAELARADWETTATGLVGILIGLVIALWIVVLVWGTRGRVSRE